MKRLNWKGSHKDAPKRTALQLHRRPEEYLHYDDGDLGLGLANTELYKIIVGAYQTNQCGSRVLKQPQQSY